MVLEDVFVPGAGKYDKVSNRGENSNEAPNFT